MYRISPRISPMKGLPREMPVLPAQWNLFLSLYLKMGGVFERFKNIEFFKKFTINEELGIITWQDELDVSPETLYSEATGAPLPSWVEH